MVVVNTLDPVVIVVENVFQLVMMGGKVHPRTMIMVNSNGNDCSKSLSHGYNEGFTDLGPILLPEDSLKCNNYYDWMLTAVQYDILEGWC